MQLIKKYSNAFLILLITLELFFLLFSKRILLSETSGQTINTLIHFVVSVSIGLILIAKFKNATLIKNTQDPKIYSGIDKGILVACFIAILLIIGSLIVLFKDHPTDPSYSDIIPSIQLMVKRWLTGEHVYAPSYDFGYLLSPTYLPTLWMPYTIAELGGFDYRWVAVSIFLIASFVLLIRCLQLSNHLIKLTVPILIFIVYISIMNTETSLVSYTVEIMIAGYYMLFIISLNQSSGLLQTVCITLCLLSRFSLLLWLPLSAFILYVSGNRAHLFKVAALVVVFVTIIYIIPFLSADWHSFTKGYEHYDRAALAEWQNHVDDKGRAMQLYSGVGFAHLFYEWHSDSQLIDKIKQLQKTHLVLSAGICVIMGVWYWFNRKKIDYRIFLLASFKIYLSFFLAFIQVPYIYLMVVANFVSVTIFAEQLRYRTIQK